jgi:hypothetical protein
MAAWMHRGTRWLIGLLLLVAPTWAAHAQQQPAPPPSTGVPLRSTIPDMPIPKFNTTVVPKATAPAPAPAPAPPAVPAGMGQLSLAALLTADGQRIDSGVVWRVFLEKGGPDGRHKLVTESRVAAPTLRLAPGDYLVNAAFGRAHLTRRLTVKQGEMPPERFILNAGGLRLSALVGNGEPAPPGTVTFDVFSDERDQFGNRAKILAGAKAGVIVRLNSGIYNVVSTYGDANAILRTDVSVEAGKLTEATVAHAVGKATFKLVMRAGGEALADTQWTITTPQGDIVKETAGALPTHMLAPGNYVVNARSQGRSFRREFTLQHSDAVQVEVLVQ